MSYQRLASPLHAARAGAAAGWCVALAMLAMCTDHPALLGIVGAGVGLAAWQARCLRAVARVVLFLLPVALLFAVLNPVVSRNGLTVFARLGDVPPLGQVDLTVEALVYGLVFGLRVLVVVGAFALLSAAIDPDELLGLLRRLSPRSALTAVLAVRLVPVLTRDAARLDEARRCRSDGGGDGVRARAAVLRAITAGALDRALDVAATLEVRGYGTYGSRTALRRPWSRHDVAFAASAVVLVALAVFVLAGGAARFDPYPLIEMQLGGRELALGAAVLVTTLLPFTSRRGIAR